jgi:hypothetical protein
MTASLASLEVVITPLDGCAGPGVDKVEVLPRTRYITNGKINWYGGTGGCLVKKWIVLGKRGARVMHSDECRGRFANLWADDPVLARRGGLINYPHDYEEMKDLIFVELEQDLLKPIPWSCNVLYLTRPTTARLWLRSEGPSRSSRRQPWARSCTDARKDNEEVDEAMLDQQEQQAEQAMQACAATSSTTPTHLQDDVIMPSSATAI